MDIRANNPYSFYETPSIDRLAVGRNCDSPRRTPRPQYVAQRRASIMTGQISGTVAHHRLLWGPATEHRWPELPQESARFIRRNMSISCPHQRRPWRKPSARPVTGQFFAGKWHLGNEGSYPEDHGFDVNKGGHERGGTRMEGTSISHRSVTRA